MSVLYEVIKERGKNLKKRGFASLRHSVSGDGGILMDQPRTIQGGRVGEDIAYQCIGVINLSP